MSAKELESEIRALRQQLQQYVHSPEQINSPQALVWSRRLDELVLEWQRQQEK